MIDRMTAQSTEPGKPKRPPRPEQQPEPQQQEKAREPVSIGEDSFTPYEAWNTHHRCVVPAGCTAKDLHGTEAWNAASKRLTAGDAVTVITSDGRRMFLGVVTVGDRGMSVRSPRVIILHDIGLPRPDESTTGLPAGTRLRMTLPSEGMQGWLGVRDEKDGSEKVLVGPYEQRDDCEYALKNHASVRGQGQVTYVNG